MTLFRDRGVVLRTIRLGEADRIVTLMTEQHGKVRAVAKGVRRTTSKFGARLEPLSHVALLGWQGRGELDIVNQVEVIDTFRAVREDLDRMARPCPCSRWSTRSPRSATPTPASTRCWWGPWRALAERNSPMVVPAFFLKVLALEGSAPVLDVCVSCGEEDADALVAFDLVEGGVLCRSCRRGRPLSPDGAGAAAPHPGRGAGRGAGRAPLAGHRRGHRPGHRGHGGPPRPPAALRAVGPGVVTGPADRPGPDREPVSPTGAVRGLRARALLPRSAATTAPSPPTPTATT